MHKNKSIINNIFFIIILVYSGYGVIIFRNPISYIGIFLLSSFVFYHNKIRFNKIILKFMFIWSFYNLLLLILYKEFHFGFYIRHINYFFTSFIIFNIWEDRLFIKYEKVMFFFAGISLFFFVWQIISFSSLNRLMDLINLNEVGSKNCFFYTLHFRTWSDNINRNCGFTWEPGPFSLFILIAIYFNLMRKGFVLKSNIVLIVFIITIITTFSTTGIVALFMLLTYYLISNSELTLRRFISLVFFASIFIFVFLNTDFLFYKILSLFRSGNTENILQNAIRTSSNTVSLGRFAVFGVGIKDFLSYPIIGYGSVSRLSFLYSNNIEANIVSGMAMIIGQYGILGTFFFLYSIFKSSKLVALKLCGKSRYAMAIILLSGTFAFHLQTFVFLYCFILYYWFVKSIKVYK